MLGNNDLVSIIIVTHNNEKEIEECLDSIMDHSTDNCEVIIVDNASTDNTCSIIKNQLLKNYSQIQFIESSTNLGYGGGNNLGFNHCNGNIIVILNPDLVVDRSWLSELIKALNKYPDADLIASNVLLYSDKRKINACGNEIHFTGLVFSRMYGDDECDCKEEYIAAPSGAAFMFKRLSLKKVNRNKPFDDDLKMEYSDSDLALQIIGKGGKCVIIPSSKVYHKFRFKMNPERYFGLEKGRYVILRHFTRRTRFRILPPLLLTEAITWAYAIHMGGGFLSAKLRVYAWLINPFKSKKDLFRSKQKDLLLLQYMTPKISLYREVTSNISVSSKHLEFINRFYTKIYHSTIRSLQ